MPSHPAGEPQRPGVRRGGAQYERIHGDLARAAAAALARRGYGDLAPEAVASEAGVSPRTAFRHYPTKLDLALAGIDALPDYSGWLEEVVAGESMADRLRRGLLVGAGHDELLAPVMATCLSHRDEQPELLLQLRRHVLKPRERAIGAFLEEGKARGEIREAVGSTAMSALDVGLFMMGGLGQFPLGRGRRRAQRLFEQIWPVICAPGHEDD